MLKIVYDPAPRNTDEIFSEEDRNRFFERFEVVTVNPENRAHIYKTELPSTDILISQQPINSSMLDAATRLRAIINVETNFLPNIDYNTCFRRGIHVLTPASVFATAVAEIALGMALSLARDIHTAHLDF